MTNKLQLKKITQSETAQWKEMRESLYNGVDDAFHNQEMADIIQNNNWQCLFVMYDEMVIGFIELSHRNIVDGCITSPVPYIEGIFLKPKFRQKGIGKQIIEILKTWCIDNGYREIAADTELDNKAAQQFFKSIGFEETYRTVGFRTLLQ